ncbi:MULTISPECIES: hypothetical protein [unclassified Mesorhizobium]|uniref:hypothetical protein n=1 Tax=unclassified Mesorhizobium TaxID=325217 RepID=UPI000FCA4529|nr:MULTISPECIES: hypothetical protein [unclassified Mesorhizobium]RUU54543.1 hypothetical protein EOC99_29285 [Mesorhizobium sp. M7A.T.Ca.TU.009.01.1.1]RUU75627.1 hypothetical protein EOD03_24675 [Mesorhizobium sp. M7A.T.Ca.TU.009.01.1.2]RUT85551.1 hypothetical protein EOD14_16995 [Mesorhizobium sp. M7A.T.Ca.US.000.02.1.1]RUT91369.1 hypothetical protein EOD15_15030 [Mesorhizobium sp. M7A.T.Ca.US.000.02.2.1]RUU05913.1 hypothetical protein EOD12_01660 [Mesorhizobium sp. M7A.T.Ca.TU.009.02.1.1]
MQHFRPIYLAALAYLFLATSAKADEVFSWTYPADSLAQLKGAKTPFVAAAAGKISADWIFIADSFGKIGDPTQAFQRSMDHNRMLLETAAARPDAELSSMLVSDVEDDISIKARYISKVNIVTVSSYSEIGLEVVTMKKGKEIDGYFVGFSPRHLAGNDPMFRFNNPTSPSKGTLPPGRYEMTAILNGKIVQRQEISIGIFGQEGGTVTCLVP